MILLIINIFLMGSLVFLCLIHFKESSGLYSFRNKWVKLINEISKLDIRTYERDEAIGFLRTLIAELQKKKYQTAWLYFIHVIGAGMLLIKDSIPQFNSLFPNIKIILSPQYVEIFKRFVWLWFIITIIYSIIDYSFTKKQDEEWNKFYKQWNKTHEFAMLNLKFRRG